MNRRNFLGRTLGAACIAIAAKLPDLSGVKIREKKRLPEIQITGSYYTQAVNLCYSGPIWNQLNSSTPLLDRLNAS